MDESDTDTEEVVDTFRTLLIAHRLLTPDNNEITLLNKLQGLVTNIKWSPTEVNDLFVALLKRFESTTNDRSHLLSWMLEMLHCIEINDVTPGWTSQTGKTLIELVRDKTVTDEHLKKSVADDKEKELDEILEEIRQQKLDQVDEKLLDDVKHIVSTFEKDVTSLNDGSQWSVLKKVLLRLCWAAEAAAHFRPRLTQMVSWCIMALSKTGWLIQVGTGEGKSCTVAMFAAFRAMREEKVDIMTSSSVLAERDFKDWQKFYDILNISVSCNTNKQDPGSLKQCYKSQVVYGTAHKFAGDWLSQRFERVDIFGQRTFQCAIVDEVDSLMLDKGNHMVYISSDMPALQHLNPLLAFIWATANQYRKIGTETIVGRKYPFLQVLLESITNGEDIDEFTILQMAEDTGILAKDSVKDLRKNLNLLTEKTASITVNQLAKFYQTVEKRFPSCQFALHCMNNDGAIEELNKGSQKDTDGRRRVPLLLINGGFCQFIHSNKESMLSTAEAEIKRALHFTPCELSKDDITCNVPGFLSNLVDSKLKVWIENAFKAQAMAIGKEYIKEKHGIVPVDYSSTGVVENFMTLSDGLQQFLEMKHESKLSDMTAITNYMSSVGLFLKYGSQIFGVSGTLGQQAEIETLQKIYGVKTCQIPTFKRRKLFEVEGVIVDDEKEWIEKICDVVTAQTNPAPYRAQRTALVICETINRAMIVHHALRNKVSNKKLYVSNNMDNSEIFTELQAGDVIVATNLAGRGTDLQVSDQIKTAGGLFVVQTFLPENARVEAQAFGRTARQGSPGSAQLIVCANHLPEPLKLLALLVELLSLLENLTNSMSLFQHAFVEQFRWYQKSHRDDKLKWLRLTLLHILTKTVDSGVKMVKDARDRFAAERLTSFLECDIPNIKKKEELFDQYLHIRDGLYKSSCNKPADSLVSALNETWGMWLLTNLNEKDSIEALKSKLEGDMKRARQKLGQRESPSSNLHHYTAFGNELRKTRHLAESIKMYTKAIQEDHCWAAIAYYNRAFASLGQEKHQDRSCIDQALTDLLNALESVEFYHAQIQVTDTYSTQKIKGSCCDAITRFDKHMRVRYEVLNSLKRNMIEAIKKLKKARDTGGDVKVTEKSIISLNPQGDSFFLTALKIQYLYLILSRNPLKLRQLINDPSYDILTELQCLASLGLTHVYTLDISFSLRGFFSKMFK